MRRLHVAPGCRPYSTIDADPYTLLQVQTVVPDSLGLTADSTDSDKRSAGGGGVGAHILSALFPEDDSEGGGRMLDQKISLPQCQVDISCIDDEDGLGFSLGGDGDGAESASREEQETDDAAMLDLEARTRGIVGSGARAGRSFNVKYAMLLPLWDEQEDGDVQRVRGVEWCRGRLEVLLEAIAAGREDGVALGDLDLVALGFESAESAGSQKRRKISHARPTAGDGGDGEAAGSSAAAQDREEEEVPGQELLEMAVVALQNQGRALRVRGLHHYRYVSTRWAHMWSLNREASRSKLPAQAPAAVAAGDDGEAGGGAARSDGSSGSRGGKDVESKGSAGQGSKSAGTPEHAAGDRSREKMAGDGGTGAGARAAAPNTSLDGEVVATAEGVGVHAGQVEAAKDAGRRPGVGGGQRVDSGRGLEGVEGRLKEALVDGQVAGPWLTMEGVAASGSASLSGSDPLENLRAAICEAVYKHPGMPEEALAQRFHVLNPRTLG